MISLNQQRADITQLIKQVGEATGRTILYDDSVRGVVTIVAKRPVSLEEAWSMLDSSLSVRGFSLLPSTEGMWRIAKVADAVGESPYVKDLDKHRDAYVTSLIPLRIAKAETVLSVLEPLAGSSVTLVPFARTNSLIASGPERRIARLTTIADAIDQVDERPITFRVIRYRDVADIVGWIESFFDSGELSADDVEIWSDERTNSLIFRANEVDEIRLRELADKLDRPIEGEGKIRVLRVLNRDAEEVAELIRAMGESNNTSSPLFAAPLGARSALTGSDYGITVDVPTRSLVVRADPKVHRAIREILEEIDVPPQLIAVDLKLTEVRTPSAFSLGFAFSVPLSSGDDAGDVFARLVSTPGGVGLAATPSPETTLFGRVDQDLNVPFTASDGTEIAIPIANTGVIEAGDRKIRSEVLLEPSLIVTAGDTHEIFVGNNFPVPVQAGSTPVEGETVTSGAVSLTRETTIERRDVGVSLRIEVQASKVGPIAIDLEVEISRLVPSLAGDIEQVGPTFLERKFVVNAHLNDGQAAIVATNKDTKTTKVVAGTPFFSSIPFFGMFFTSKREVSEDQRLFLAAKVRRVSSPAELVADSIRRRLAFERRSARNSAFPAVADGEPGFAVLVTTRGRRDDADSIAQSLDFRGYHTEIHAWTLHDQELYDVYVTSLETMADAAEVASLLNREGWQADLTLLPRRS
jgi:general secretion pathway protein D